MFYYFVILSVVYNSLFKLYHFPFSILTNHPAATEESLGGLLILTLRFSFLFFRGFLSFFAFTFLEHIKITVFSLVAYFSVLASYSVTFSFSAVAGF